MNQTTTEPQVKLYRGSASAIVDQYKHYSSLKLYATALKLKALFPLSFITDFKAKSGSIANDLGVSRRTLHTWVKRLVQAGFASYEGTTLRLLSNTEIKLKYSKRKKRKHKYELVNLSQVYMAVKSQPITENILLQQRMIDIKRKSKAVAKITSGNESYYRQLISQAPHAKADVLDTTVITQEKSAKLLGYKTTTSGYRWLRKFSSANIIAIESNTIRISRQEFNLYRETNPRKLLIKGRGNEAQFFFCNANTVKNIPKPVVHPTKLLTYSVTSYLFLDNY